MAWAVLLGSGILESVWAVALSESDGFSNPLPTVVFLLACAGSMLGLSYAVQRLPIGTSYAVWVGIGAALTVIYGMVTGAEPASPVRIALIAGLICCVVGLKLVSD